MYFVATYNKESVAVVVFDSPENSNYVREREIGWSTTQRDARLQRIASNSRFLVGSDYKGCLILRRRCSLLL